MYVYQYVYIYIYIYTLFTNVPLDETIDITVKKLFGRKKKYEGFSKEQFRKLLSLAVKNSFFFLMVHTMSNLMV